jgi:hypothetical protein
MQRPVPHRTVRVNSVEVRSEKGTQPGVGVALRSGNSLRRPAKGDR